MRLPGLPSLLFLAVVLVLLPYAAVRSRQVIRAAEGGAEGALPSRTGILVQSVFTLTIVCALAWLAGRSFGYDPFAVPGELGVRDWLAGLCALALAGWLAWASRRFRTPEERRNLAIYHWMPRTAGERALFVVVAVLAGLVEETAYRGVAVAVLDDAVGSIWPRPSRWRTRSRDGSRVSRYSRWRG